MFLLSSRVIDEPSRRSSVHGTCAVVIAVNVERYDARVDDSSLVSAHESVFARGCVLFYITTRTLYYYIEHRQTRAGIL